PASACLGHAGDGLYRFQPERRSCTAIRDPTRRRRLRVRDGADRRYGERAFGPDKRTLLASRSIARTAAIEIRLVSPQRYRPRGGVERTGGRRRMKPMVEPVSLERG